MVTAEAKERDEGYEFVGIQLRSDLSLLLTAHWSELVTWSLPTARATGKCEKACGYLMHCKRHCHRDHSCHLLFLF